MLYRPDGHVSLCHDWFVSGAMPHASLKLAWPYIHLLCVLGIGVAQALHLSTVQLQGTALSCVLKQETSCCLACVVLVKVKMRDKHAHGTAAKWLFSQPVLV